MSYAHEQRDSERVTINTAVTLTYGNPERTCEGMCRDISASGVGVEVDSVIPLGAECSIRIHDGRNRVKKYQAIVEIKRIHTLQNGIFLLGAVILERVEHNFFKL